MKTYLSLAFLFFTGILCAFSSTHLTQENNYLQNNNIHDVFYYDTTTDNISDLWRGNTSASWYNEPQNPADDFTGTSHASRWNIFGNPMIDNFVTLNTSGSGLLQRLSSDDRWSLAGDFDIRIRYRDITLSANTEIFLEVQVSGGSTISIGRYYSGTTHYYSKRETAQAPVYSPTTHTDGWLKISRFSGTISLWYGWWDSVPSPTGISWKWTQVGSSVSGQTSPVIVNTGSYNYGAGQASVLAVLDDFYCNCATPAYSYSQSQTRSEVGEFPQRALIVASDLGIDILNADTNDMWMRFRGYDTEDENEINIQNMVAGKITTLYALDGRIYCGAYEGNMQALAVIDFTTDSAWAYDSHSGNGTGWRCFGNIASRNLHQGWTDMNQTYVALKTGKVYDLSARKIGDDTFVAIANGIDSSTNNGVVSVVNVTDNTLSWDQVNANKPVILVNIASDNSLIYVDLNLLARNTSTWRNPGLFSTNYSRTISTVDDIEPASIVSTSQFVYIGEKALTSPYTNGATTKYRISDLSYLNVVYKIGGSPTVPLWGSASSTALASDGHALWLGTNNPTHGRIYIMGIDGFQPNMLRGDFNYPDPLPNKEINCLCYGTDAASNQFLYAGFVSAGLVRISGSANELSVNYMDSGTIQHNFNTRSAFTFSYRGKTISVTPYTSGTLTTLEMSLMDSDPPCSHPEHTLDFHFSLASRDLFTSLPIRIQAYFNDPAPDGNLNTHIWRLNNEDNYWVLDSDDPFTNVIEIVFGSQSGTMDYTSNTLGNWAFNDGDGGMLSFPPQAPDFMNISLNSGFIELEWQAVDTDTGGYLITDPIYRKVMISNDYSYWWDGTDTGELFGDEWRCPANSPNRLYMIKLERREPIPAP